MSNYNNSYTVILTGTNTYNTTTIGGGNSQVAGVPSMRLNIGNGGTSGTLGTGAVTINGDGANGVLGFDRADGYTLAQTITSGGSQLTRTFLDINTLGAGFDSAGFAINLGTAAAGGNLRVGVARAAALGTISGSLTGGNVQVGSGANLPGATLNFASGANVAVNNIFVATASTNATVNIAPGAIVSAANAFQVGEQNGFSGSVFQTGGAVSVGNQLRVGHWPNETSTYSLSGGGTIDITSAAGGTSPYSVGVGEQNGGIYVGIDGVGVMDHTDGDVTTNWVVIDNRGNSPGTDQYNLAGGNLNIKSAYGIIQRNVSAEFNFTGGRIKNVGVGIDAAIDVTLILGSGGIGTPTIDTNGATNTFTVMQGMTGVGDLTKVSEGKLRISVASPTWSGDLYAEGGTTVVKAALGDGTNDVTVDSTAGLDADDPVSLFFTTSQTLASLSIGPNGTVTLDALADSLAPAPSFGGGELGAEGGDLAGAPLQGVPEPGSAALLFGGMLTLLGIRRRR